MRFLDLCDVERVEVDGQVYYAHEIKTKRDRPSGRYLHRHREKGGSLAGLRAAYRIADGGAGSNRGQKETLGTV